MNQADEDRLVRLNKAVTEAIQARREFLDAKMLEYSPLKVGDEIYELENCTCVGIVTGIYRFWRDRNEGVSDTSLSYDYQYRSSDSRVVYNTSGQHGILFGSKEDARKELGRRLERLKGKE